MEINKLFGEVSSDLDKANKEIANLHLLVARKNFIIDQLLDKEINFKSVLESNDILIRGLLQFKMSAEYVLAANEKSILKLIAQNEIIIRSVKYCKTNNNSLRRENLHLHNTLKQMGLE